MTTARKEIVDLEISRWYHCISRCVRGASLMQDSPDDSPPDLPLQDRKQWIEDRLEVLTGLFSVAVAGFAILDNHLHVLCRLDPHVADGWTAEEVLRRWVTLYPPANMDLENEPVVTAWIKRESSNLNRVETLRERLKSLSWFMKALKEPLSRMANQQDGAQGAFWQARFKSIALLDEEALLAVAVYIDLNLVAAGLAPTPELSPHTSVQQRVEHAALQDKLEDLSAAQLGSVAGSLAAGNLEDDHWLIPIEDRRQLPNGPIEVREGMLPTFSLGSYLLLVDYTGRLFRSGKAVIHESVQGIFERLQTSVEFWQTCMKRMLSSVDWRGNFFATETSRVRELSAQQGKRRINLAPQLERTAA